MISSAPVEKAFLAVSRSKFLWSYLDETNTVVPASTEELDFLSRVYSDTSILIRPWTMPYGASSSTMPSLMALMLEALDLQEGMSVLEIGTGSGYNAAVMAEIVGSRGRVTSVDIQPDLCESARRALDELGYLWAEVHCADGVLGHDSSAPHDRVIATAECADIAPAWGRQLQPSGRMVIPLRHGCGAPALSLVRDGDALGGNVVTWSEFMPLQGRSYDAERDPTMHMLRKNIRRSAVRSAVMREPLPTERYFDFAYYLGLVDHRASRVVMRDHADESVIAAGCGLFERKLGSALIERNGNAVVSVGDVRLEAAIVDRLEEWRQTGMPRVRDYEILIEPRSAPVRREWTWTIERQWHRQYARLGQSPGPLTVDGGSTRGRA